MVEVVKPLQLEEEIEPGTESGRFSGRFSDYKWTRTIEVEGEEEDGLLKITTRVHWSDRRKQAYEEVVTLLYHPDPEEDGSFDRTSP